MSLSGLRSKDKGRRGSRDASVWTDKKNVVNVNIANAPVFSESVQQGLLDSLEW